MLLMDLQINRNNGQDAVFPPIKFGEIWSFGGLDCIRYDNTKEIKNSIQELCKKSKKEGSIKVDIDKSK